MISAAEHRHQRGRWPAAPSVPPPIPLLPAISPLFRWTTHTPLPIITHRVTQSVEQVVKRFEKAAARLRREHRDPKKARDFLIRAGIAVKSKSSPSGIRLAKRFR